MSFALEFDDIVNGLVILIGLKPFSYTITEPLLSTINDKGTLKSV